MKGFDLVIINTNRFVMNKVIKVIKIFLRSCNNVLQWKQLDCEKIFP